ncbi:cytochrome-c peroxidase [Aerosakkonemataceae cyanobacterium BLCC-F154]|uniref:Cytochrome-c peroxidase n=1 Tax=Floridaenema fluviatile BLCC-F154 TaxID=3153640 RepID=A0ABV4YK28_9CYAN
MLNQKMCKFILLICTVIIFSGMMGGVFTPIPASSSIPLSNEQKLGKSIFFDNTLSLNENQSCATCHVPQIGWTGDDELINVKGSVYEGSVKTLFGNRKPPTVAYATFSPILHFIIDEEQPLFVGGNFYDGRATGEKLGNPAADQAQGPFMQNVEQGLVDSAYIVHRVCENKYPVSLTDIWGKEICNISWSKMDSKAGDKEVVLSSEERSKVEKAYDAIAQSIAAYEASPEVSAFTSKYDYYLAGKVQLTPQEAKGLELFNDKGKCAECHISKPGLHGERPLFTDFTYDNLGTPPNPENPWYTMPTKINPDGKNWVDKGLGEFLATNRWYKFYANANMGKQKVPTLRNVDMRPSSEFKKAYTHNGYFKSLKSVVHFYNTRDTIPTCPSRMTEAESLAKNCWPAPEVKENVNKDELGDLRLTDAEEDAIVAFMKTLTDGYNVSN